MTRERALPIILIVLQAGAAITYAIAKDWRHAAYWVFGAGITTTVTLM